MTTDEKPAPLAALFDIDAEMRLLGVCLEHNEVVQALAGLEARHFYEPFHQRAWTFITKKVEAGVAVDPLTVHDAFKDGDPAYEELGGLRYLAMLVEHVAAKGAAPEYARIIVERSTRRDLVETAALIAEKARDPSEDLREVVTKSEALLSEIARGSEPNDAILTEPPS